MFFPRLLIAHCLSNSYSDRAITDNGTPAAMQVRKVRSLSQTKERDRPISEVSKNDFSILWRFPQLAKDTFPSQNLCFPYRPYRRRFAGSDQCGAVWRQRGIAGWRDMGWRVCAAE